MDETGVQEQKREYPPRIPVSQPLRRVRERCLLPPPSVRHIQEGGELRGMGDREPDPGCQQQRDLQLPG